MITPKPDQVCAALAASEEKIDAIKKEISATEKRPRTADEAVALGAQALERQLAYSDTQLMAGFFWKSKSGGSGMCPQTVYGASFMFHGRDALFKTQEKQIRAIAPPGGISSAERESKLAELQTQQFENWCEWTREYVRLKELGLTIIPRGDANPLAVRKILQDLSPDKPRDMLPELQRRADAFKTYVNRRNDPVSVHGPVLTE
jgi:hypothetical protein